MAMFPGRAVPFTVSRRTAYRQGLPARVLPYANTSYIQNYVVVQRTVNGQPWTTLALVSRLWHRDDELGGADPQITAAEAAQFNAFGNSLSALLGVPPPADVSLSGPGASNIGVTGAARVGYIAVEERNRYFPGRTRRDTAGLFWSRIHFGFVDSTGARITLTPATNATGGVIVGDVTMVIPGGQDEAEYQIGPETPLEGFFDVEVVTVEPLLDAVPESALQSAGTTRRQVNVVVAPQRGFVVLSGRAAAVGLDEDSIDGVWSMDGQVWTIRGASAVDIGDYAVTLERRTGESV